MIQDFLRSVMARMETTSIENWPRCFVEAEIEENQRLFDLVQSYKKIEGSGEEGE